MIKRLVTIFIFLVTMLWLANYAKRAHAKIQVEEFTTYVTAKVVDLPLCGASNIITIEYNGKRYDVSVNKNDCIQGKYRIGDLFRVEYNDRLDEMNPNPTGSYRISLFFLGVEGLVFIIYLYVTRNPAGTKSRSAGMFNQQNTKLK